MHTKKLWIISILVILLAISYAILIKLEKKPAKAPLKVETKTLDSAVIPSGFPAKLPVEPGSSVLQNYEATTNDGRRQSTRVATTNKPLAEAVKVYSDYFVHLGWLVIPTDKPQDNTVTTMLRNGNDTLLITANTDPTSKQSSVSLTLTQSTTKTPGNNIKN
jgi:hypothetical protein